jgi:hypothetical protein
MKVHLIKSLSIFILAPAFLVAFTSKADKANFSGQWKLNESKSDLGRFANFATRTMKTEQKDDNITIARTAPSFNGDDFTSTETLTFDGKEAESKLFGNSTKKSIAKWSDDGQTLTITYTMFLDFNGNTTEIKGTETWTLSDGGKTLTVQNNSTSSFGDLATKSVFEKQ